MADSADWVTVGGASKGDSHAHGKDSKRVVRGDQGGRSREPRRADKREGEKKEKGEERPSRSPVKKPARVAKEVVEAPVAAEAAPASVDGKLSFRAALLTAKAAEAKAAAAAAVASGDAAPVKGSRAHVVDTSKAADAPSVSATTHSPSPLAATAVKHNVDTHASASVPEVATVTAAAAPKTWAATLLRAPVAPAPAPAPVTAPQSHVPVAAPITHAAPASIVPAPVAPVAATAPATKAESTVATKAAETIDTASKPASTFSYRDAVKKVVVPSSKPKVLGGEEGGVSTSVVAPSPALGDTVSGTMVILPSGGALGASPVTSPDATTNSQSDSVWAALSKTIAKNAGDSHPGSLHATATLGSSLGLSAHLSGLTAPAPTHDAGAAIRKIVLNADAAEFVPTFVSKA